MKTWKAQMKTLDMHRAIIDDMIVCVLFHRAGYIDSRSHKLAFIAPYTKIIEPLSKLSGASAPGQESLDEPKPLASMLTEHLGRDFTIEQVANLWKQRPRIFGPFLLIVTGISATGLSAIDVIVFSPLNTSFTEETKQALVTMTRQRANVYYIADHSRHQGFLAKLMMQYI
jgi:hypothetical protein